MENPKNFSFSGFAKLTRIGNLLIIALAQYMTAIFIIADQSRQYDVLTDPKLFLLSLSSVLIAAAGYIINDYYDVKIDYINKPDRVVVGKVLKRRVVMVAHTMINFAGIGLGFLVSPIVAIINFLSALLLWLYSNQLKRMPLAGNLSVALLTGLSIYIVEIVFRSGNQFVLVYAAFAFGYTVIREIVKDMEDVKGDETFGCKTIPIVYGLRVTKWIILAFSLIFTMSLSAALISINSDFITILIVGNVAMLTMLMVLLYNADTVKQLHNLSTTTKIMMMIGVLSMILI